MSLQEAPRSIRVHIGIFGKRNSGKSSLINSLTNQSTAIVSKIAGTTTDPVYKSMEIYGIGPCVFIDTAGFDDVGEIGALRISQTKKAMEKTDIAIMLFCDIVTKEEKDWVLQLKKSNIPVIFAINKIDVIENSQHIKKSIEDEFDASPIMVSTLSGEGIDKIRTELIRALPADFEGESITPNFLQKDDVVLLVMPQDIQAPKGRIILPQLQVTRELLDKKCIIISITTDSIDTALAELKNPPKLIITDSQIFKTVYEKKPKESLLTSFSILMAGYKGDLDYFVKSASAIEGLTENSRVLIAEACTHAPLTEDIGREKLPRWLREKIGEALVIDVVSGSNFPEDVSGYDLIIHCGGCMFNKKYLLSRVEKARCANVPMSNYGVVIAYLSDILEKINLL